MSRKKVLSKKEIERAVQFGKTKPSRYEIWKFSGGSLSKPCKQRSSLLYPYLNKSAGAETAQFGTIMFFICLAGAIIWSGMYLVTEATKPSEGKFLRPTAFIPTLDFAQMGNATPTAQYNFLTGENTIFSKGSVEVVPEVNISHANTQIVVYTWTPAPTRTPTQTRTPAPTPTVRATGNYGGVLSGAFGGNSAGGGVFSFATSSRVIPTRVIPITIIQTSPPIFVTSVHVVTATLTPTETPTPTPTETETPTPTETEAFTPTPTETEAITETPTETPTETATATPTLTMTVTLTVTPEPTATLLPTATLEPTLEPTIEMPTAEPTVEP